MMTLEQLEQRVQDLERQVSELRAELKPLRPLGSIKDTFVPEPDQLRGQVMLVLDTDHLVEYQKGTSVESRRLEQRLDRAGEPYGTTIITVEEMLRGWMAAIRRIQDPEHDARPAC